MLLYSLAKHAPWDQCGARTTGLLVGVITLADWVSNSVVVRFVTSAIKQLVTITSAIKQLGKAHISLAVKCHNGCSRTAHALPVSCTCMHWPSFGKSATSNTSVNCPQDDIHCQNDIVDGSNLHMSWWSYIEAIIVVNYLIQARFKVNFTWVESLTPTAIVTHLHLELCCSPALKHHKFMKRNSTNRSILETCPK